YGPSVAGLAVFAAGGLLDMLWHLRFGIENGVSALLSPTHQLLAFGMTLILLGPVRAAILRGPVARFGAALPALISLGTFLALLDFFTQWTIVPGAGALAAPSVKFPELSGNALIEFEAYQLSHGFLGMIVLGATMSGVVLFALRCGLLRFGGATLIVFLGTLALAYMRLSVSWAALSLLVVPSLFAGLTADWFVLRLRAGEGPFWRVQLLGFALPFVFWFAHLIATGVRDHGYWWEVHALTGSVVMAGFGGALLATLMGALRSRAAAPNGG
ncbi:MAG TPA: hypothetical protein VKG44_05345, partial [Candidatus Baltobacteraceae bacterium]|nr:hypothetical protein [Candidatus Baltobacteraceae bacterium]